MKKLILTLGIAFASFSLFAANSTEAYYNSETECLGVELDGSQTLRVWATGRNKTDAIEQCKKNAVNEVGVLGHDQGTGLQAVYHHHAQHDGGEGVTGYAQRKQRNHCAAHAGVVCSFGSHDTAHVSGSVFLGVF